MAMGVEIISRDTIKPSSPTPSHLKTYSLSFFDQLAPPIFVPILLFYTNTNTTTSTKCLKESLSKCLTKFYTLAGRIKDGIFVDCNDAGVDYLEAKVTNRSLSDVVANPNVDYLKQLLPCEPHTLESKSWSESPLLAVQVNRFQCGGVVIGMCISHKVADASSLSSFVNGWSCIARGDCDAVAPHFGLATLFPWIDYMDQEFEATDEGTKKGNKIVTKRFVFNASNIARLREKARDGSSMKPPTRVEVVSAFIWKRFMNSDRYSKSHPTSKSYSACHAVNLRKRRVPPLAEHGFGNMCIATTASLTTSDKDDDDEYCSLVSKIRGAIRGIDGEFVKKVESGDEWSLDYIKAEIMQACKGERVQINFSSWCKLGFYDADFGWGRPVWVTCTTVSLKNLVIMVDTRNGDGIEALVNMLEDDMVGFESDPELLALASEATTI
ncbi:hypothetical protein Scep_018062 [Stephania cephalantha]|uniref:Uncharacterized protein n=1 Tax=Stephania cephalantha TaxID=152367 RepID=A0AAP0IQM5_9MAGN